MSFVIVGAGALGIIIAGHLAKAGQDVTLVARGKRAAFLRDNGITLTGLVDFNTPCKIVENVGEIKTADVLIIAVKTYDMEGVLAGSDIHSEALYMIQGVEWSKFTSWIGLMAVAVLTRVETHKFLSHVGTAIICARLMREVATLANALGIPLEDAPLLPVQTIAAGSEQEAVETLLQLGALMKKNAPAHRVSTLQDLISGKRLEVEETLGYVMKKAAEKGVSIPTVDTCYRLISVIDHTLSRQLANP